MFSNKIKRFFAIGLLCLISASCGGRGAQTEQITLKWWGVQADEYEMRPILDAFRAQYPNINVQYQKRNLATYESDLLDAFAAGEGPDVFSIHNSWVPKYLNKITPAPVGKFQIAQFKREFLDTVSVDFVRGTDVYGIPLSVDTLALYYNKDIMRSGGVVLPPKTWSELATAARKMTKIDASDNITTYGLAFGASGNITRAVDILYLLMLQGRSGDWSPDRTRPVFFEGRTVDGKTAYPALEALKFFTSFTNSDSSNYSWSPDAPNSLDVFAAGKLGMMFAYASSYQQIINKSPNLQFDIAEIPQPNLQDPKVNFASYFGEVVHKNSKYQNAAWELIRIATSKEVLAKYYKGKRVPSSRFDLADTQVTDADVGIFATSGLTAKSFYRPDQLKVDRSFGETIDDIVLRGRSYEDAMRLLEQKVYNLGNPTY